MQYRDVVAPDRARRFGKNGASVPTRSRIVRHWSRRGVGYADDRVGLAYAARADVTGIAPRRRASSESVAVSRLVKGDRVAVECRRTGARKWAAYEQRVHGVFPMRRPFSGFGLDTVGNNGMCTVSLPQGLVFPGRNMRYDTYHRRGEGVGLSRRRETTGKSREETIALLTGRQFPLRGDVRARPRPQRGKGR